MRIVLLALVLCAAAAYANVVPIKGERKIADAAFIERQKQILRLYIGLKQSEYYDAPTEFDFKANANQWTDPQVVDRFLSMYELHPFPTNGIFNLYEPKIRWSAFKLFDLFYFAKDFDTFYKAASWAKKNVEPAMFSYAYTLALYHRADTQQFYVPPMYEVFPNYFIPQEYMPEMFKNYVFGKKEAVFTYNNTGYEYNYNAHTYGGVIDYGITTHQHLENKVSYFREDVGLNNWYVTWMRKYPAWFDQKYGKNWFRRGEGFYYAHQQLLARYNLERVANSMQWTEMFKWDQPFAVGYNPKVSHVGGQAYFPRPNNMMPTEDNIFAYEAKMFQDRIFETLATNGLWSASNDTLLSFTDEDGIDYLGKLIFGTKDLPSQKYYGSYFFKSLQALANIGGQYRNNFDGNSGVISNPLTTLRDPLYFSFLAKLVYTMQLHKFQLPKYTKKDLAFPGVTIKDMDFDKLTTYFEMYKYSVFNAIPVKDNKEYKELKYYARQFRLNHKPYTYKITADSDAAYEGMVRVFVGPKYDSEEHIMSLSQKRMAMFEIDRFPVKINAGQNVFERNSKESPIFEAERYGIREMYEKLDKAAAKTEPFYYYQEQVTCGFPDRFQLPRGWKNGQPFTFYVVITPFTKHFEGDEKEFYLTCGTPKLYDFKPLGFPFDRPVNEEDFKLPNIFSKDFLIYHKEEVVDN